MKLKLFFIFSHPPPSLPLAAIRRSMFIIIPQKLVFVKYQFASIFDEFGDQFITSVNFTLHNIKEN